MSRSGYTEDPDDQWQFIRWRGAVTSAIKGRRGQAFLKEMLAAMDAMPIKRLAKNELIDTEPMSVGHWGMHPVEAVCAMGVVGKQRGINLEQIDPDDSDTVADVLNISRALACEIAYMNDEWTGYWSKETPEERFQRMRSWVEANIIDSDPNRVP